MGISFSESGRGFQLYLHGFGALVKREFGRGGPRENVPFQMDGAESGFAESFVRVFKAGGHPLVDDRPANGKLYQTFL